MSASIRTLESHLDSVVARAENLAQTGPAWLNALRQKGLRTFQEHGIPSTKNEEWKYTSLKDFALQSWAPAQPGPAVFESELAPFSEGAIRIVLVNGRFDRNLSIPDGAPLPSGLTIKPLHDAVTEDADWLRLYLGQSGSQSTKTFDREINPDIYPFGELNTATFEDGVVVRVHARASIDRLVEIIHITSEAGQSLSAPRILIVAETGSSCKITESYLSDGNDSSTVISMTEVFVDEGANLEHVRIQDQGPRTNHIGVWQTNQSKDSIYTAFNVVYGAKLSRLDQCIWIAGEGCTTRLDGVVCANGDQHMDNHTRLDHAVPNCNSFEIYKQVIDDRATVVFNGKIFVHQDAQKTDAKQTNQALLLSPTATIDSKPQLEIFADDVKCTHGATVGQLEDLPMFYMRSRGVPKDTAEAVLVYAFAAEVLELISCKEVRVALERKLYQKLGVDLA